MHKEPVLNSRFPKKGDFNNRRSKPRPAEENVRMEAIEPHLIEKGGLNLGQVSWPMIGWAVGALAIMLTTAVTASSWATRHYDSLMHRLNSIDVSVDAIDRGMTDMNRHLDQLDRNLASLSPVRHTGLDP